MTKDARIGLSFISVLDQQNKIIALVLVILYSIVKFTERGMQVSRIYSPTSDTIPFIENCIQIGLSEDVACTDFVENVSVKSLKQTVSIETTFYNPALFSLHNTVKDMYYTVLLTSR
jgi:hypothetical protein